MRKKCTGCGKTRDISKFRFVQSKNRHLAECFECESSRKKDYKARNKEYLRAKDREWQKANPARVKAAQDRWKAKNPTLAKERASEWYRENKKMVRQRERERYHDLKNTVYEAYGAFCNCCGEDEPFFLSIDHVNNDGNVRRKQLKYGVGRNGGGIGLYKQIIKENFPPTYQILCMMCNWGKARNTIHPGICPHKHREGSTIRAKARRVKRPEARSPG